VVQAAPRGTPAVAWQVYRREWTLDALKLRDGDMLAARTVAGALHRVLARAVARCVELDMAIGALQAR